MRGCCGRTSSAPATDNAAVAVAELQTTCGSRGAVVCKFPTLFPYILHSHIGITQYNYYIN